MSTNALVGILNEDGTIESIYNHCDGDSLLDVLKDDYTDEDSVRSMLARGDASSLYETKRGWFDWNNYVYFYLFEPEECEWTMYDSHGIVIKSIWVGDLSKERIFSDDISCNVNETLKEQMIIKAMEALIVKSGYYCDIGIDAVNAVNRTLEAMADD